MYLIKAKKQLQQEDERELQEKKEKHMQEKVHRETPGKSSTTPVSMKTKDAENFKPDELPDGSCFRPKGVMANDQDGETAIRPAEYIGSFSVTGTDQNGRAEFVQKQLETMRNATKSKKVLLVVSLGGVKVCSSSGESVYMAHALKRISYAASDPDFRQFAFLAREPKGHIDLQFCHAFTTSTMEQAEELNTIIGNAFKMAYAQQRHHQPTFNELIEQQLAEQKVKFQEYQQEAQRAFQERLTEIATPTPFSEKALQRMEIRRQSSSDDLQEREFVVGKNKVWAKQAVEKVHHRSPLIEAPKGSSQQPSTSNRPASANINTNRSSYDPSLAMKRNSTPPHSSPVKQQFGGLLDPPSKRNSSLQFPPPMQSFSVMTIRESIDSDTNNSNRFKGSPVTALKDAIDRTFTNGGFDSIDSGFSFRREETNSLSTASRTSTNPESPRSSKMLNRPLPALPNETNGYPNSRVSPRHKPWSSFDDDSIPRSTKSPPYYARQRNSQDSPKRRPQRPQSEIFLDSKASGSVFGLQEPGMYIYGFKQESASSQVIIAGTSVSDVKKSPKSNQRYDSTTQNAKNGHGSMSAAMMRYQNDSPFTEQKVLSYETPEDGNMESNKQGGLESLMGLDRSHIEDETLRHSSWYQAGIPRDVALEILQQEEIGSFIVRDSTTHPGCYALSVRVPKFENPTGISHYLVLKTQRGVKLKGLEKEWPNLVSLVTHHTVMPEMLPCTLRLPRNTNNPTFKDSDKDDKDEDPDYQRLADFSTMMAALKK